MNCKEFSPVSALFFVLIPVIIARSTSRARIPDLIDETCLKTTYPAFCTSMLRPDIRSAKAKGPGDLGVILLDRVDLNAQSAITKINELIYQAEDPKVKQALSGCNEGYISTVSQWVPFSRDSFASDDTRFAFQYMTDTAQAAVHCEDGLKGLGIFPLLTEENDFSDKAALVCAAIAESLM